MRTGNTVAITALTLLLCAGCSVKPSFEHARYAGGAGAGNPTNTVVASKILDSICQVISQCNRVPYDSCITNVLGLAGMDQPFGLQAGMYENFKAIIDSEASGTLGANLSAGDSCSAQIGTLSCASPQVIGAYDPSSPAPFAGVPSMIPAQPGGCIDVFSTLQISPSALIINVTDTQLFSASGGVPPYAFSLVAGAGTITAAGLYHAPALPSSETVRVTDSAGHTSDVSFKVVVSGPFTWTGKSDSGWNNAANWQGGAVPGSSNIAVFDGTCRANCSVVISGAITVGGMYLHSSFTGSVTQTPGLGNTVHVTTSYNQDGGSFIGGNASIISDGPWVITGGSFTSTSGTLSFTHGDLTIASSTAFSANGGTLEILSDGTQLSTAGVNWNNVNFASPWANSQTIVGTMNVLGDLTINKPESNLNGGVINLSGNLIATQSSFGSGNSTLVRFVGTGNQSWSGSAPIPRVEIANQGTLTLSGAVTCRDLTYTSGAVQTSGSTVQFTTNGVTAAINSGPLVFGSVSFISPYTDLEVISGTMNVSGDLTVNQAAGFTGGSIALSGNLNWLNGAAGSTAFAFNGPSDQTYSLARSSMIGPVAINKPAGSALTLLSDMSTSAFTISGGSVSLNGHALHVLNALNIGAGATLSCAGGCGNGSSCGLGLGKLTCGSLTDSGMIVP